MNQLTSEFEPSASVAEAPRVATGGPVLSSARLDRLLAEPSPEPEVHGLPSALPIHGIWLGAGVGVLGWLLLAAGFLFLR